VVVKSASCDQNITLIYLWKPAVNRKHCIFIVSRVLHVLCRYVHSECDEGVEQSKLKPEEYVCLACKNHRDSLPVCQFCTCLHLLSCTQVDTTHHFNSHLPGKPGLVSCPLDSQYPVILILSLLTGQAESSSSFIFLCRQVEVAHRVLRTVPHPLNIKCHPKGFWSRHPNAACVVQPTVLKHRLHLKNGYEFDSANIFFWCKIFFHWL